MGVYTRKDSPFYWMTGLGIRPQSTRVLIDAPTKWQRDQQRVSAELIYAQAVERIARSVHGLPPIRDAITFRQFAPWYAAHVAPKHRGVARERECLVQLARFFDPVEVAAITREKVTEYQTARHAAGVRPQTINREVDVLKAVLKAAVPAYLESSPIAGMPKLRPLPRRKAVLTADEERRVLAHLKPPDRALFIVAVDTLVRLGDVLDLRRDHDQGTYLVIPDSKTGYYEVPVSKRVREALDSLEAHGPYYFWHRRTAERPATWVRTVRWNFRRACEKAGVPYGRKLGGVTWHTGTRASGATRMLQRGVDPATVQKIGHWASLAQMSEYLHPSPALTAAVDLIAPDARSTHVVPSGRKRPQTPTKPRTPKHPTDGRIH